MKYFYLLLACFLSLPVLAQNRDAISIRNIPVDVAAPTNGQALYYNSTNRYLKWTTPATSSGAPTNAQYVTLMTDSTISDERVLTGTANQITITDNGAGNTVVLSLTVGNIIAGTYTPTLTNVANLDGSTAFECQYVRIGSIVIVSGKVNVNPTTTVTSTQLGISLPIASNLGAAEDCAGTAFAPAIAAQGAAILGDTTNDRAQMQWVAGDVTDQPMHFQFLYQII